MSSDERLTILEEFSRLMVQWARRAEERMDALAEAQANSEAKIAALADAQIRTEEAMTRLTSQQAHSDQRLDALIDIVREMREGRPPQGT